MATRTISTKLAIDGESAYRASLSRINSEIKTLQSALKLTESQYQTNANSMAALTAKGEALTTLYKAQESKVKELKSALENAQKAEKEYAAQKASLTEKIQANNQALEALKSTTGDTSEEQAKLTAENKELTQQLETCDANLTAAQKGVNSWQTQLNSAQIKLNDLDAELKLNDEYMDEAQQSTDGCATSIDRFGDRVDSAADKADTLKDALASAGVIAALKETAEALEDCAEASIEFESGMAGVAKTTDLTETELSDMADAIQEMATRIPSTTTEIAEVVESAGQLGIAKEDLLSFAEVMVNLGVATNLSSTEAASALAKFANVVGTSSDDYERLGSVIVDLGNNFATTEADIVSMATRLSATGSLVGLSESQIMAIATALSSVGIEAEAGGSAISKLLKQFETMVATQSEDLQKFTAVAGMSAEEFSEAWGEDAVGALSKFINGLGDIDASGGSAVAVLEDLDITEVRLSNAVLALASSEGILDKALETADSAWEENTALATEATTRYETTESKLTMLSNACNNVKIAIGDKLTPAVGDLATTGTEVLTWAEEFIEDSDLLVPVITAAAAAIGVLAAGIVTYTAVTKLATTAMGLFTAVLDTNPIFLAVTAVAALAAGIAVLVATADDAVPSVKELTTAAQELPEAWEEANSTYEESETEVLAAAAAAQKYIDRLRELEVQGTLTTEQQDEYAQIVDTLQYLLPEVNIELDEQTGLLIGGADALQVQTDAWKELALQEALSTKYTTQKQAWADATLEVSENQIKLNEAEAEAATLTERLSQVQQEMSEICEEQNAVMADSTLTLKEQTEKYNELGEALPSLYCEMQNLQGQLDENEKTQENLTQAIADGTTTAGEYEQQVKDAQAALDAYEESAENAASGTDDLNSSAAQNYQTIQTLQEDLTNLAASYAEAYQSAYDSINGQISLFDTFAASAEEDTLTVEEMLERWAEQTANLSAYTENLKKAAQYGLDDGLITSLADGSTESAAYLATIIEKIEELGGSTDDMSADASEFVAEFNTAFAGTVTARESFATTVAGIETDLTDTIAAMEETAASADFTGFSTALETAFDGINKDLEEIGVNIGTGLSAGIDNSTDDVTTSATDLSEAVIDAGKTTLGVHSPSTVFEEIGENVDLGLEQGIENDVDNVVNAVESMGKQVTTQMQQSAKQAIEAYDKEFSQITSKTRTTCNSLYSTVTSSTSGLSSTMSNIGAQMVNGMISGLNSKSSSLYSKITSIVNTAIYKAKRAAAVNSPSKKTTEIFEYVGEGMVVGLENKRQKIKAEAQSVVDDALNVRADNRLKSAVEGIDTGTPAGIDAIIGKTLENSKTSSKEVIVTINISRFENNSDRDLDQIVEYVEDSLQSKIDKKEAAL